MFISLRSWYFLPVQPDIVNNIVIKNTNKSAEI